MKEIWFQGPSDEEAHKVLGGPYEEIEANILMKELQEIHDTDFYWLEEVA